MENLWKDNSRETSPSFILLSLGAPIIKIELDEVNLNAAIHDAEDTLLAYEEMADRKISLRMARKLLKSGALAYAKVTLGLIRRKYANPPGPNGGVQMDGQELVNEGTLGIRDFESSLMWVLGL